MSNVTRLSEIDPAPILRNKTFFPNLDAVYGTSRCTQHNIGMPVGKISLWAGESGVGKSRLCIEVAKKFSTGYTNGVVLYFQTESTLADFASWSEHTRQYNKIFCSAEDSIDNIIKIIYQVNPRLVFIDSVNEIVEFENGSKQESRRLIKGYDGHIGLKKVASDLGCHIVLLGQLNQDGKTIKGGSSLPHFVDHHLNITKTNNPNVFMVQIGLKNRGGAKDHKAFFKHTDSGVEACQEGQEVLVPSSPAKKENRVPAMTRSGTCKVNKNGLPDYNDPEFQEHLANLRQSQQENMGLWNRLNQKAGKILGI